MKKIHYSSELKRQMTGRGKRVRHHLSSDQKLDIRDFFVWAGAILAFAAACAAFIGIL